MYPDEVEVVVVGEVEVEVVVVVVIDLIVVVVEVVSFVRINMVMNVWRICTVLSCKE